MTDQPSVQVKIETHSVFACPFCDFAVEITQPGRATVEETHRRYTDHLRLEHMPNGVGDALTMQRKATTP